MRTSRPNSDTNIYRIGEEAGKNANNEQYAVAWKKKGMENNLGQKRIIIIVRRIVAVQCNAMQICNAMPGRTPPQASGVSDSAPEFESQPWYFYVERRFNYMRTWIIIG